MPFHLSLMNDERSRSVRSAQLLALTSNPAARHAQSSPLACAHSESCASAQIYEVAYLKVVYGIFDFAYAHLLTFAYYGFILQTVEFNL